MSDKPFVFDTSSFVRAWCEAYPIDVVETFWEKLHDAMDGGIVIAPDEVLRETCEAQRWTAQVAQGARGPVHRVDR